MASIVTQDAHFVLFETRELDVSETHIYQHETDQSHSTTTIRRYNQTASSEIILLLTMFPMSNLFKIIMSHFVNDTQKKSSYLWTVITVQITIEVIKVTCILMREMLKSIREYISKDKITHQLTDYEIEVILFEYKLINQISILIIELLVNIRLIPYITTPW